MAAIQLLRSAQFLFSILARKCTLPVAPRPPRNRQLADSWAARSLGTPGLVAASITQIGRKRCSLVSVREMQPRTGILLFPRAQARCPAPPDLLLGAGERKTAVRRISEPGFFWGGGSRLPVCGPAAMRAHEHHGWVQLHRGLSPCSSEPSPVASASTSPAFLQQQRPCHAGDYQETT